ncbi:unnamed protein product [Cyprideis torosa]|uniref:Uncharacterized protein n=1 Tax=Cyprideis torosa TaxID=163714 RepID=A0A7R8WXB1_9CRUS|nr:unnamed protein product [Cyprideis torosa]CAG0910849.1 unnamed protein product [Cyprideis torosa]
MLPNLRIKAPLPVGSMIPSQRSQTLSLISLLTPWFEAIGVARPRSTSPSKGPPEGLAGPRQDGLPVTALPQKPAERPLGPKLQRRLKITQQPPSQGRGEPPRTRPPPNPSPSQPPFSQRGPLFKNRVRVGPR